MIKRFGTLYAGQVDLDNTGFEGTPVNERWLSDEHLATAHETAEALAVQMDRLGYDTLWFAEHHFQREGYECLPNILLLAVHLAAKTQNLRIGCGFNIAPMWHPLRLAEDFAVAERLTGGRVRFGLGRGYHSREVETFGAAVLDQQANRELFEEQVEVIFKAFNERAFRHEGKHYTLPPRVPNRGYELEELTLVPRPRSLPVECWQPIVSASERALDFMVRNGIKGFIGGGAASGGVQPPVVLAWRDMLARYGRKTELGADLIMGFNYYIADTEEQAIKEATPLLEEYQKMFAPLGFAGPLTDDQIEKMADRKRAHQAGLPTLRENVGKGSWFCGPPELIAEKLMEVQAAYPGLEEIIAGQPVGTPSRILYEQLEIFAKEVIPRVQKG
jgi:alkanesulfonate monooxygenase SsuD/methylene tetrahydromethanopterin reductase-like flavin-dependent oxidoreductase (luciferase family)